MELRNVVGEYDAAMVLCASKDEVEDLEEEDVTKIEKLVSNCRSDMKKECFPLSQWMATDDISSKIKWVQEAHETFQRNLGVIMAAYVDEDDENVEVDGGDADSDMD
jgi:hypothetical protein